MSESWVGNLNNNQNDRQGMDEAIMCTDSRLEFLPEGPQGRLSQTRNSPSHLYSSHHARVEAVV